MSEKLFLNLGCEKEYRTKTDSVRWINLDFDKRIKADVYHNLNKFPWPFKDNEFDGVLASMVLEHLDDVPKAMMEMYRILRDGAEIYIMVPHFSNPFRHTEFEHKHFFSILSFGEWWNNKEIFPYFEVVKKKISFTRLNLRFMNFLNFFINLNPVFYERLFSGILPSSAVVFILRARKNKKFHEKQIAFMEKMETSQITDNLKFIKKI